MATEYDLLFLPKMVQSSVMSLETTLCVVLFTAVLALWLVPGGLAWVLARPGATNPIPGPSGFPLVGLAHVLAGSTPHRALADLARSFGFPKLMAYSVGLTRFVISTHPETAKEILGSPAFADRPVKESAYELLFHRAIGFAPYGKYWRKLRRISGTHLFSTKRVSGLGDIRNGIGSGMVEEIRALMGVKGEVEVKKVLHYGSLRSMMLSVFGKSHGGGELEEMVGEGYELLGMFNWSDHFPVVGWLDLQGVKKRCRGLVARVNVFVGKIIDEHRVKRGGRGGGGEEEQFRDFVDVLLDLEEEDNLSDSDMIAVLWEMIFRGTDTVAILLEWILARMVLHPEIQSKAQSEIDAVVGNYRPVSDSDIPSLPYLQNIVKETLRLHPPGPLLSWARLAAADVHVGDSFIPAGTTALVNMWAISRDENVWPESEKFMPERFADEDVSVMGADLRLAPFGAGRRVCPGKAMGLAAVHLWLAQLLQSFKWVPSDCGVDLSERLKLSLEMKNSLVCKALPRVRVA
ncbi:cytochrome P450 78A5-like [Malania oleifera]|uniref:cytochrome P450 78A5-like n=1 Tax=Malania oleifera TaxID=397392 RepID=UPI0025AE3D39|nr:cytochrome P450 78A5-like [Malania oleifera]